MNFALGTLEIKNDILERLRRGEMETEIQKKYNKLGTKIYFWRSAKENKIVDVSLRFKFRGEEVYVD